MYGCGCIAGTGCPLKLKNIYYILYNDLRRMPVVYKAYKLFKTVYVLQVLPMYTTRTITNTDY